jgi:DNA-binding beta-propeller fold protein YncE
MSVFGGREGMPYSLGSVLGGSVLRYLGGLRGVVSRSISTLGTIPTHNGIALSRDGCTLFLTDNHYAGCSHAVHVFNVHGGERVHIIGGLGTGPRQFVYPCQVSVASDDYVFVADSGNHRIQILTPRDFEFHAFVGEGDLSSPTGVCADERHVVVSETRYPRISVFARRDGALLRRIGLLACCYGDLYVPRGLCFLGGNNHFAVADSNHVSVFSVNGEFVRHVGVGYVHFGYGVAYSASSDELVVANGFSDLSGSAKRHGVFVFRASGELVKAVECSASRGVAVHSERIVTVHTRGYMCDVIT